MTDKPNYEIRTNHGPKDYYAVLADAIVFGVDGEKPILNIRVSRNKNHIVYEVESDEECQSLINSLEQVRAKVWPKTL